MELRWPTDRIDYVPITQRQPLPLPDGAKVIVWPCVNVEHWVISEPMPRTVVAPPGGAAARVPDIPNWAWHEYGQRVGFWRLKAIFDDFGVAGSLVMNSSVCDVYPHIVDAEGKITIPPEVLQKRGLQPGDTVALVEAAEGLLVYQGGIDPKTLAWWQTLSDEERRLAEAEARRYAALSDAERDALWNEGAETLDAEDDELELPAL